MSEPVSAGSDPVTPSSPSKFDSLVDPQYNPMVAALMMNDISVSLSEADTTPVQAALPRLDSVSGESIERKMSLRYGEIISQLLDSWRENNEEIAEKSKESQRISDQKKDQLDREKKAEKKVADQLDHSAGVFTPVTGNDFWQNGLTSIFSLYIHDPSKSAGIEKIDPCDMTSAEAQKSVEIAARRGENIDPTSVMTSALIIGVGFVGSFQTPEVSGAAQIDNKVIQDAWNQLMIGHQPNDPITQLAGWVSALWGVGLVYFTATQGVQQIESTKGNPLKDLEFAVKYAQNLVRALATPEFALQLKAIVMSNISSTEKLDPKRLDNLTRMAKVILLTLALAQIMKLEVGASFKDKVYEGHLTGDEVVAMIEGKVDFQTHDPRALSLVKATLIMQINILMGQLPEETRGLLLERFRAYFNGNPSVEKLSDVNRVMGDLFSSSHIEEAHLGENRV